MQRWRQRHLGGRARAFGLANIGTAHPLVTANRHYGAPISSVLMLKRPMPPTAPLIADQQCDDRQPDRRTARDFGVGITNNGTGR